MYLVKNVLLGAIKTSFYPLSSCSADRQFIIQK